MNKTYKSSGHLKLFISNAELVWKKLFYTYWIFFGFRSLTNITLQCIYVQLQRSLDNVSKMDKKREINNMIEQTRNLMFFIGQPHRETGTSGIFHYSIIAYSWVIFFLFGRILVDKNLIDARNEGLLCFLGDSARERKIISARIDKLLKMLIESNLNFTRIMLNNRQNSYKFFSSQALIDSQISIGLQKSQLKQLNKLKSETYRIWPANRVTGWANNIRKSWFKLYISSYVNIWLICVIVVSLSLIYSHNALIASNLDENYTKFNLLDRLWSFDMILYCSIASSWYAESLSIAIISVYDQLKFANDFKLRLHSIRSRINRLNYLALEIPSKSDNEQVCTTSMKDFHGNKVKFQDSQIECDKVMVEFYIAFRLFRDDLRNTLKLTQTTVGKSVTLIITTLLTTLCFYDQIPDDQITLVLIGTIVMIISINCAFVLCAELHASSCHITDLVWSLISLAENHNLMSFLSEPRDILDNPIGMPKYYLSFGQSNFEFNVNFDFEYYSHSLISPHTVFLLRKITADHTFLVRDCVCRLYGSIPLDYKGIMRANFWLISSILLSLTYYS